MHKTCWFTSLHLSVHAMQVSLLQPVPVDSGLYPNVPYASRMGRPVFRLSVQIYEYVVLAKRVS